MLESTVCLFEQLWRHGEVALGCAQADMAEIGRQRGKQALDVRILPIPLGQPMNRECVAQIMKPRLEVRVVAAFDACDPSQTREACIGNLDRKGTTALRLKQ
jgi:hypothetical protein